MNKVVQIAADEGHLSNAAIRAAGLISVFLR